MYLLHKVFMYFTFGFILIYNLVKCLKFHNMRFIGYLSASYFVQVHNT
jgi:hypothetical protein